jgi:hypothetical protein
LVLFPNHAQSEEKTASLIVQALLKNRTKIFTGYVGDSYASSESNSENNSIRLSSNNSSSYSLLLPNYPATNALHNRTQISNRHASFGRSFSRSSLASIFKPALSRIEDDEGFSSMPTVATASDSIDSKLVTHQTAQVSESMPNLFVSDIATAASATPASSDTPADTPKASGRLRIRPWSAQSTIPPKYPTTSGKEKPAPPQPVSIDTIDTEAAGATLQRSATMPPCAKQIPISTATTALADTASFQAIWNRLVGEIDQLKQRISDPTASIEITTAFLDRFDSLASEWSTTMAKINTDKQ